MLKSSQKHFLLEMRKLMEELNEKFNMPDGEMYLADLFFFFFFFYKNDDHILQTKN